MIDPKLRAKFDALAAHVAEEGIKEGKPYNERTDALKAVTAYYAAITKGKKPDHEPFEGPFAKLLEDGDGVSAARRRGAAPAKRD